MRIDLDIARNAGNELKTYRNKLKEMNESMRRIHTELSAQECEALEEELAEMYRNLEELDDRIAELDSLIVGLNGIINIYEKTEKKNMAKVNNVGVAFKGKAQDVFITIPNRISGLFR